MSAMRGYEAKEAVKGLTPGDKAAEVEKILSKRTPGVPRALNNFEWEVLKAVVDDLVTLEGIARVFRK